MKQNKDWYNYKQRGIKESKKEKGMIISFNLDLKESTNGVSKHIYIILTGGVSSVYIFYYFEQKNLLSIINLTE